MSQNFNNCAEEAIGTGRIVRAYDGTIITSTQTASADGKYTELHEMTGLPKFIASLAGHVATGAAR